MTYKERVRNEIKEEKLKELWERICEDYQQGGSETVKALLNSLIDNFKKEYKQLLERLEKML